MLLLSGSPLSIPFALPLLLVPLFGQNANGDGFALLNSIAAMAAAVKLALSLLSLLGLLPFALLAPKRGAATLPGGLERHDDLVPDLELRDILTLLPLLASLLLLLLLLPLLLLLLPLLLLLGTGLATLLPRLADLSLLRDPDHVQVLPLPAGHPLAALSLALLLTLRRLAFLLILLPLALVTLLILLPLTGTSLPALTFPGRSPEHHQIVRLGDDRLPRRRVDQCFADNCHAGDGSADPLLLLLPALLILLLLAAGLIAALFGAVLFLGGNTRHEQQRHEQSG